MSRICWPILALCILVGCSEIDDFELSREAIRNQLRDPASAEFRAESIRTLWTRGGQRLTVYCAEVNANNAFGGKTGFKPAIHVLQQNLSGHVAPNWPVGKVYIYENEAAGDYYLNCLRSDTERRDESFGKFVGAFGEPTRAEIDSVEPVLSQKTAPSE